MSASPIPPFSPSLLHSGGCTAEQLYRWVRSRAAWRSTLRYTPSKRTVTLGHAPSAAPRGISAYSALEAALTRATGSGRVALSTGTRRVLTERLMLTLDQCTHRPIGPGAADKGLYWNSLPFGEFLWIRMGIHLRIYRGILQIVLNSRVPVSGMNRTPFFDPKKGVPYQRLSPQSGLALCDTLHM